MAIQAKRHRKADKAERLRNTPARPVAKAPVPAAVPKSNLQNVGTRPSKGRANRLMATADSLSGTIKVRSSPRPVAPKFDKGAVPFNPEMSAKLGRAVRRLNKVTPPKGSKFKQGGKSTAKGRKRK